MPMKKIEDRDRKDFYYRCENPDCPGRGYETEPKKKAKSNIDEKPPLCPKCGK